MNGYWIGAGISILGMIGLAYEMLIKPQRPLQYTAVDHAERPDSHRRRRWAGAARG